MNKNKILIASISGIAAVIIGIIVTMLATGKFGDLKKAFEEETTAVTQPLTTQAPAKSEGRPKSAVPESIVACEYSEYTENSEKDLASYEKFGFNTVIFELNEKNSAEVSALLETVKNLKLYFGIRADISQGSGFLTDFDSRFNTDFIILSGSDESLSDYTETVGKICTALKENDPATLIGLEPVYTSKATPALTDFIANGKADFVYLRHDSEKNDAFTSAQAVWNEKSCPLWLCHSLKGLSGFSTEDASAIIELISASADMQMCRALAFSPFADISKASGTSADIVMNYILERDTYLLDKEFSLTSHKKTNITVEQSTITFRGTSSPAHELKCNGKVLKVAKNGDFSVDINLKVGENTVKFEHKGKTYTYKVTYKIKLLKSVSPSESITVPGEMLVEVSAVANKNATLSVSFNGKTYKMTATDDSSGEDKPDENSDFTTFTATLDTPKSTDSVQKLGQYKVVAKYNSLTESLLGASISVTEKIVVKPPETTQPVTTTTTTTTTQTSTENNTDNSSDPGASSTESESGGETTSSTVTESETNAPSGTMQKYSYKENYGLGTAKICKIIDDYVETYPGHNTKTFSVPDCSPLLKDTVDYVTSIATCDDETYYFLESGIKVPELREERLASGYEGKIKHVSIEDGYVMPKNNINVLSSSTSSGDTVIVLEMNRAVPFNAKLTGQSYSYYDKAKERPVVVSNLNCSGLEFTFSDTESVSGDISLMNSVCKSGKWSKDRGDSTVTLSLKLAQSGKFYGFHYEYDRNGNLVITINHKPSSSLSGYTIMLDPGHGGIDGGAGCAVSSAGFGAEKHINLSIATKVKELLEAEGAKVIMTRTTDKWVCYADRNAAVRNNNPDMFIAIHCDSSSTASAMGTSAYYYRAYSQPLAKAVHERLVDAYKNNIYKNEDSSVKNKVSRGANFYAFRVTRVEECPAILIEYGFVSNVQECQVLQTAANRDILAAATVEGIKDYIRSN